jgi:hypothetical protein
VSCGALAKIMFSVSPGTCPSFFRINP